MPLSRKLVRKIDLVALLCAVFPLVMLHISNALRQQGWKLDNGTEQPEAISKFSAFPAAQFS